MKATLEEREEEFKKHVYDVGGAIYTKRMLDRFIATWTEPDRKKHPKLRFEKESTWRTSSRLAYWASVNYENIICFLSDSQKTIQEKKKAFAITLEPFLMEYGREMLNAFYRHFSQPENIPNPERLRWECEPFWELPTRLQTWASKPNNQSQQPQQYARR